MKFVNKSIAGALAAAMLAGCGGSASTAAPSETVHASASSADGEKQATAGVVWYNFADTFISNARAVVNNLSSKDGTVKVTDADSQNDINVQDNNMNNVFTKHPDFFVLNNINNAATSQIINSAKKEDITTLFVNTTSPSDADFENYDKLWYVSSASEQSGQNMGNEIVEYFKSHDNWDHNGNGKVDYILLQGISTFSDTINRSSYSLATIEGSGFTLGTNIGGDDVTGVKGGDSINGVICSFQRAEAQENVEALLSAYGNDIDCILADNDDEALGAIAALQAHGYLTNDSNYIPVVGVDATAAGCEAIKNGTMLGTSLNNPVKLGKSIYKLMYLLTKGEDVTTESIGIDGVNVIGHKVIIDYIPITKENVNDASYDINDTSF